MIEKHRITKHLHGIATNDLKFGVHAPIIMCVRVLARDNYNYNDCFGGTLNCQPS